MARNALKEREDRELDDRESTSRVERWTPPGALPKPRKVKGYAHRWIRVSVGNEADPKNISAKLREGWEPCKPEDYPEIKGVFDDDSRFRGSIIMGGSMLCRCSKELMKQRKQYYEDMTKSQMRSVNRSLSNENDPRMPLFNEGKTKVKFGKGALS